MFLENSLVIRDNERTPFHRLSRSQQAGEERMTRDGIDD
jgi:hypothetical protein